MTFSDASKGPGMGHHGHHAHHGRHISNPLGKQSKAGQMLPALPEDVIKLRFDDRGDPWWDPCKTLVSNLARLPRRFYKQLFHYTRPDTNHKIIRQPEWDHLHSEWRYVHSLFVYIGRPTRIIARCRLPLFINFMVCVVLIVNEEINMNSEATTTLVPTFAHEAVIQMFQMNTFALALLLTLRLNRTYERWWDAWRSFRRLGDCAVALVQQATVFCPDDLTLQAEIARWAVLWCYSMVQFCSGDAQLEPMAQRLLSAEEVAVFNAAPNKFNFVELKLRKLCNRMKLTADRGISVDAHIREGWQCVRTCSTVKQTALPYALTLMCTGFIEIALILLPIGFIGRPYHQLAPTLTTGQRITGVILLIALYLITNLLLLGGDEVACQMEDPFLVLPLNDRTEGVVDLIRRTFDEAHELDELEAAIASRGGSEWGDMERAETLKRLESIVINVQPMHKSDSMTRMSSGGDVPPPAHAHARGSHPGARSQPGSRTRSPLV